MIERPSFRPAGRLMLSNGKLGDIFISLFFFVLPEGRAFFLYPVLLAGRSIGVTLPFDAADMIIFEIKVGGT